MSTFSWLAACGAGAAQEDAIQGVTDTAADQDAAVDADADADAASAPTDADADAAPTDATAATDADADAADAATDADIACPPDRVPRVVDGVVVDPCGCCAIGGEYCHGLLSGGSPYNGMCPTVQDAVPPCTSGRDANGCETLDCSGSCIDPPDTHQGEPDAG
ncbi:MAG: hypothetical protein CVU56_00475 [Deltaproteobacteria bacterium HGW-Deltaproteobacteria-14]|nr:MAG: hypothetical protein CVU56_00475 [Deltaproteobacteria bacterium HGW-Deltaproteobacteria-14]